MSPRVRFSLSCTALITMALIGGLSRKVPPANAAIRPALALVGAALVAPPTIDRLTTNRHVTHLPGGPLVLLGTSRTYFLNDSTSFNAGAGSAILAYMTLDSVEVDADSVHYVMRSPADSIAFFRIDGGFNGNATQGTLGVAGPLVLSAALGSTLAVMSGTLRILENAPFTKGAPAFRYFSSRIGNVVPFTVAYTSTVAWTETSFDLGFACELNGEVDFRHPLPPAPLLGVEVRGPKRVGAPSRTQYTAQAHYPGNLWIDVSSQVIWSSSGDSRATIDAGVLSVGGIGAGTTSIGLRAALDDVIGELEVQASEDRSQGPESEWPMYQADAKHTGFRPVTIDPAAFVPRWTANLGLTAFWSLAAAEGKVFCLRAPGPTLVALDRTTGETLWSYEFRSMFYVSPPSYADGSVYVQTTGNASDMYVWAFDASSGAVQFHSRGFTQWGVYLAPTIADGKIYTPGGYYDGAYSFNAITGDNLWMNDQLPQYDRWAAAVDSEFIYVFLNPGDTRLYAIDRVSGLLAYTIVDADPYVLDPLGSSSPVLGSLHRAYAVSRGKLHCYDLLARTKAWTLSRHFIGQPAVARGVIFANDNGALTALDESTQTDMWSWRPPAGSLIDGIIVTNSQAFISNGATTYAVDLVSHQATWSYPAGGIMALAEGMLYIVTPAGVLHAIEHADLPTATVLRRFDGFPEPTGVRLVWEFNEPDLWTGVVVERSTRADGEWTPVEGPVLADGPGFEVVDAEVAPDVRYWYRLRGVGSDQRVHMFGVIVVTTEMSLSTTTFELGGSNPSRVFVRLEWEIPQATRVQIQALDLQGRLVSNLVNGTMPGGRSSTVSSLPALLPPGVYLLMFRAGDVTMTRRMVVCR